jgi:hypothetical protein
MTQYSLQADVHTPYLDVFCATVGDGEIRSLLFESYVSEGDIDNSTYLKERPGIPFKNYHDVYFELNKEYNTMSTPLDSIYGWNETSRPPCKWNFT